MNTVSIITINYNNAEGLEKTIKSVIRQKEVTAEFIVIDGGSTDKSVNTIKSNSEYITSWISEADNGIYEAQNKGIWKATGNYCLFLNSGDTLSTDTVLKDVSPWLGAYDIVYGDLITESQGKRERHVSPKNADVYQFMISTLWHPATFIKRGLFQTFGTYRTDFKIAGDYEFFIRSILKGGASTKHIPVTVAVFDLGGVSNSQHAATLQEQERKKSWELNFSKPVIKLFEEKTRLMRSREYRWGKWFTRLTNLSK